MNTARSICLSLLLSAFWLNAQQYQIQGTIKNQADFPAKNIVVKLSLAKYADTTDTAGAFLITGPLIASVNRPASAHRAPEAPRFAGGRFVVAAANGPNHLSIDLFTLQGRRVTTLFSGTIAQGEHSFPMTGSNATVSSGVLLARVMLDQAACCFKLVKNGPHSFSCTREDATVFAATGTWSRSGQLAMDTLLFLRKDSLEYAIPVSATVASYEVLLDLLPYEITEDVAIKEQGRGPDSVGIELKNLGIYPYDLWRYLTGPEDAWCSEFLCWAYRYAGYPLGSDAGTNAARPQWLKKGNTDIRAWFQDTAHKHEWIDRSSPKWDSFVPVYGDFVRYDNAGGGHTGIVRYVRGTSLYTVEGNVNNRCMIRTISNYKNTSSSIDGFGRRSGVRQDSYRQVN